MGWVWRDDDGGSKITNSKSRPSSLSSDWDSSCTTRTVVRSRCKTEEVEPGKFLRKCHKTEELLRDCLGKPVEVLESNNEYTEEDVTDLMAKGSASERQQLDGPFNFPGLRNDVENIERHFLGAFGRFSDAVEEMTRGFFDVFGGFPDNPSSSPSTRQRFPFEGHRSNESSSGGREFTSGGIDLSDLGRDV